MLRHASPGTPLALPLAAQTREALMLRITFLAGPGPAPTLELEGKLVGPWVGELRQECDLLVGPPRLDLTAVTFADEAGVRLLGELLDGGAELAGCSGLLAALLRPEAS